MMISGALTTLLFFAHPAMPISSMTVDKITVVLVVRARSNLDAMLCILCMKLNLNATPDVFSTGAHFLMVNFDCVKLCF